MAEKVNVFLQNPFDNLPLEGYRKQRYWMMAEAFVRAGHRVVLWTSSFNHTTKAARRVTPKSEGGRVVVSEGFEVRLLATPPYRRNVGLERVRSHRAYAREWERAVLAEDWRGREPDLIVTSMPTISAAEAAFRLAGRFKARVVVDVQDAWPETFERLAPKGLRFLARAALAPLRQRARRIYREADLVTGSCERYRDLVGRDDYYRAYLGVEEIASEADAAAREKGLVYAGNLGRTYDIGTPLRTVSRLGTSLSIAGRGALEGRWKRLAERLGLGDSVTFHGYCDADGLRTLLRRHSIGVVPMPPESFVGVPNKFCEYAAAGLKIVSSLGGESAELLEKYRCGASYKPGDRDSFVEAVRKAEALPRENALALARAEFDAVKIYDAYVRHVTGGPGGT